MQSTFPAGEVESRWERARAGLAALDLDALLVSNRHNYQYLTGHFSRQFEHTMRPMFAILPRKGTPVVVVYGLEEAGAKKSAAGAEVLSYRDAPMSPELLVEAVRRTGARRIGAELGVYQRLFLAPQDVTYMQEKLPDVRLLDAGDLIWDLRMRKSAAEVALMTEACNIAHGAWTRFLPRWQRGDSADRRTRDLAAEMVLMGADHEVVGHVSTKVFAEGTVWCDLGCAYQSYHSDMARRAFHGEPTAEQERIHAQGARILQATIDAIRPGIPVSDVARAANAALEAEGWPAIPAGKRVGHGVGLSQTEPPSISLTDDTILAPGMVLTPEPRFDLPDGQRVHLEEVVVVTEDGCRQLSSGAAELVRMAP